VKTDSSDCSDRDPGKVVPARGGGGREGLHTRVQIAQWLEVTSDRVDAHLAFGVREGIHFSQ